MWTVTTTCESYNEAQEIARWCERQARVASVQVDHAPERCVECHGETHRGAEDEPGCERCGRGPLCPGCLLDRHDDCRPAAAPVRPVEGVADGDIRW